MTRLLDTGPPIDIAKDEIVATPARLHFIKSSLAVEVADDVAFTAPVALTNAETVGAWNSAPFLRCTGGACTVTCRTN